jgi:putative (di)nucleoside polyphosphate hydrolase
MCEDMLAPDDAGYRPGVGIMLLDRRGRVFVARRIDIAAETWQMPQGGIDEDEDPRAAALRELKEEIGTDKAEILAESKGWLRYDLPAELLQAARHGPWRGQRQKWFVMRFTGEDGDIDLATGHPESSAWKWVEVRELPELIVSFKRQVYLDLLSEFAALSLLHGLSPDLLRLMDEPIVRKMMAADRVSESELYDLLVRVSDHLRRRALSQRDGGESSGA